MQFVLDNIVALLVGAVLLGVLATVTHRRQVESVSLVGHQVAAGRAASLADWLQSDLHSLTAIVSRSDSTFTFRRSADPAALSAVEVEYRRVRVAGTPTRYRIVRREGGAELTVGPAVSAWAVTLLTAASEPAGSPSQARAVRVRVVTAPAFSNDGPAEASVWERTFTPRMLGPLTV